MALGVWANNIQLTVCLSGSWLSLAEGGVESLQKLLTLLLSVETNGQIIRTEPVDITQYLLVFLLENVNENIYLIREAPCSKQRRPYSLKVEKNKLSLSPAENTGTNRAITSGPTRDKTRALGEIHDSLQEPLFLLTTRWVQCC